MLARLDAGHHAGYLSKIIRPFQWLEGVGEGRRVINCVGPKHSLSKERRHTVSSQEIALIAHLMRRAGFGAGREELDAYAAKGYEASVEELLECADERSMPDDLIRRYHHNQSSGFAVEGAGASWLYRLISTRAPLQEKMVLLWHRIFATSYSKVPQGKVLADQLGMFRRHGMGSFRTLLVELSKDPAMIVWLDNQDNHKGAINENYGRELLELFSMGAGNYSEQDIKECARAFTGWTVANTEHTMVLARRNSIWPYGKVAWRFEYRAEDHDDEEKEFLGERGRFGGEDVIDIICKQPATARFLSRHMYHFFVADEPPVPQWPYTPPRDPEAIEALCQAYFDSDYDIRSMLRVLFNSNFFRSEESWYSKIKSPAELVAGVLRLTGEFEKPRRQILDRNRQVGYMGQMLLGPPSVEGWHEGLEWIDSGTLVERLNFASEQMGDRENPGVREMIEKVTTGERGTLSPERLVDACLDQMGAVSVSENTRSSLVDFAAKMGDLRLGTEKSDGDAQQKVGGMFQVIAATPEFQQA